MFARLMTDDFAGFIFPTAGFTFVGFEPVLNFVGCHDDRFIKRLDFRFNFVAKFQALALVRILLGFLAFTIPIA